MRDQNNLRRAGTPAQCISSFLSSAVVSISVCVLLAGCGGGGGAGGASAGDDDVSAADRSLSVDTGIAGQQTFTGRFSDSSGAPVAGLPVRILLNSKSATTDATGTAQITTDTLLQGDVDLIVGVSGSEVALTLFGIKSETKSAAYNVIINQDARTAAVTSFTSFPLASGSIALNQACQSCHTVLGEPNCSSGDFTQIHGAFFRCASGQGGPLGSNGSCQFCHGDRGAPQCDSAQWRAVHASYPCGTGSGAQNSGSWQCTSCHDWKGHTECGDPAWVANHPFSSCAGGSGDLSTLRCDSCHTLRTRPRCGDPVWEAEHPFWVCGNPRGASCQSCHDYKGAARCDSARWRSVHDFYSCSTGPTCSQCHGSRIDTQCESSRWRSIHDFATNQRQVGGMSGLCSSCHDNDRGAAQCGDDTWEAFHCFCG